MIMGLLDDAIKEANKYITVQDFLCYLAYELNEPIKEVVSFLLYSRFEDLVTEYEIDSNYRITSQSNSLNRTRALFNEIRLDGFYDYMMFYNSAFDDELMYYQNDPTSYKIVLMNFYYRLEDLQKLAFIYKFNLDLENASTLDYTVYSDDRVKAKEPKDNLRTFKLIDLTNKTDAKDEKSIIEEHGENSQVRMIFKALTQESTNNDEIEIDQTRSEMLSTIEELRKKVTELESEHTQLKEKIPLPLNVEVDEGQGDTLLILGAVMQCIKIVAKNNYTQQRLIDVMLENYPNTKSISQSTLEKKFARAKTHLNQNVTP